MYRSIVLSIVGLSMRCNIRIFFVAGQGGHAIEDADEARSWRALLLKLYRFEA